MTQGGQTLTERTRALLTTDRSVEFTVSRAALETLVADSERYAAVTAAITKSLLNARSNLSRGGYSHDGRIVWEQVITQLEGLYRGGKDDALATIEPIPSPGEGERRVRALIREMEDLPEELRLIVALSDDGRKLRAILDGAALPSEPLRDDVTRGPTCANPCCVRPADGFPVIYFGPAQEPRRYRLEVPKGMCGECQPLFHADTFFTDASRVEMSRMIDEQGLALPDYDRLAVDWIGIEDPAFAEIAALREARLWFR